MAHDAEPAGHIHAQGHHHGHGHGHGEGHGHGHRHGHQHPHHAPADTGDWRYLAGLSINLVFVIAEAASGLIAGSAALLADAGHNLSDVLGLAMAGGAAWLARRAASTRRTYGFGKATVLAALANGLLLLAACGFIAFEAIERLADPRPLKSGIVMAVAGLGFVINLGTALLFLRDRHTDLNARGAYLHMLADAGVSIGVVIVGAGVMLTGWTLLDPIASLVIVAVIFLGTWGLLRDSVDLALDTAPAGVDVSALRVALESLPGVSRVHDLHVWALSTTRTALTAHLVHERTDADTLLREAQALVRDFGVGHATLQLETTEGPDCPGC